MNVSMSQSGSGTPTLGRSEPCVARRGDEEQLSSNNDTGSEDEDWKKKIVKLVDKPQKAIALQWDENARSVRSDVAVDLSSLFTGEAVNNNKISSNVARPNIVEMNNLVKNKVSFSNQCVILSTYREQVSNATGVLVDSIGLCENVTNVCVKYGIECIHCRRATKDVFRQYPASEQDVIVALVKLQNHLTVCEGRSNVDRDFTMWSMNVSSLQVNLIASHVMNCLRN